MVRKANLIDIDQIMVCIEDARLRLKNSGSTQWNGNDGYPTKEDMLNDINNGVSYVCERDNKVVGVVAIQGYEKTYNQATAKWLSSGDYLTIHRLAVCNEYLGSGVGKELLAFSFNLAKEKELTSVRCDTHPVNAIMRGLMLKMGFVECGYVLYEYIKFDNKRLVYEKIV